MYTVASSRDSKTIEMRKAAMDTLADLMEDNENIMFFDADLGSASGSAALSKKFPEQYVQSGIAEANMVGMAAGMSAYGFVPFVHSFAPFASRRVFDQVFLSGAYAGNTLNILATDPGFAVAANGGTHTAFEDVAMMRTIPGAVVCDPCDPVQLEWLLKEVSGMSGIHYIRFTRKNVRPVYEEGSEFVLGKGNVLRQGSDVLILACGQLVSDALDAAEKLEMRGVQAEVIDLFTIKPLDIDLICKEARGKKAVVTFENHSITGGLGSAVCEAFMENGVMVPFKRLGSQEQFGQVGSVDYLQNAFGLTSDHLVQAVEDLLAASMPRPLDTAMQTAGRWVHH